jgi:uncharacterized protein (TIGR00297 family)
MLSPSGAIAATAVGTACAGAGWDWAAALIAFFLTGSAWSRIGRARKESRTAGMVAKGGERDAAQVIANGGVFALCAIGYVFWLQGNDLGLGSIRMTEGGAIWRVVAAGALASASADTWATEVGTLWGGLPRSIVTGRAVEPGASGGVTPIGTLAGFAGAACIGGLVGYLGWGPRTAAAALAGGVSGMAVDSILGASLQQRRWCERCKVTTERDIHSCETPTRVSGGLRWLDNDGVNALSTFAGACIASTVFWNLS